MFLTFWGGGITRLGFLASLSAFRWATVPEGAGNPVLTNAIPGEEAGPFLWIYSPELTHHELRRVFHQYRLFRC